MSSPATPLRIGQVHALLRSEFPDVELSKIRYYEERGLVNPARSKKGYRLYSERDVTCLREAIRMAEEEFLPLRVIRLRLIESGLLTDDGLQRTAPVRRAARAATTPTVSLLAPSSTSTKRHKVETDAPHEAPLLNIVRDDETEVAMAPPSVVTVDQLASLANVDVATINEIVGAGLVTPLVAGRDARYASDDVRTVVAAAHLLAAGAPARTLVQLRRVVERQLGIVEELTFGLRHNVQGGDVHSATREVAEDVDELRGALWQVALANFFVTR